MRERAGVLDVMPESPPARVLTSADFGIPTVPPSPSLGKAPTVFLESLRPHTYHGRPQDIGDVYLAHEHEVENIENLKFAKRVPPPPRAVRP
jgi:hypothetical protein